MITDWRLPENRLEGFHRFYDFQLKNRTHPECVYYTFGFLREHFSWDDEQALWFAFLDAITDSPLAALMLMEKAPTVKSAGAASRYWRQNSKLLPIGADRGKQRTLFPVAVESYSRMASKHGGLAKMWRAYQRGGWDAINALSRSIPSFGRLTTFSHAEYLYLFGYGVEPETLWLDDPGGSRSHRNGLCVALGLDEWKSGKDGPWPNPEQVRHLEQESERIEEAAKARAAGEPWLPDVNKYTLESAYCTYKRFGSGVSSRYPNAYSDILYSQLKKYEGRFGADRISDSFWQARAKTQRPELLLENNPFDPGHVADKRRHYTATGEMVMMHIDFPDMKSAFDYEVEARAFGEREE